MEQEALKTQVASLPDAPGIYKFFNSQDVLIYVGKAKNLKKRVASYFTNTNQHSGKTAKLVSEISHMAFTITNTEFDALLLENNFIKQNQPRYNILLKDGKTFPYLCIINEPFPRIISTRRYVRKQGEYFGPYSSVVSMKNVLELLRELYTIRTCSLLLNQKNILANKFKVCLEYHIGNCKGPCAGLQSEDDYKADIQQARHILRGDLSAVAAHFQGQMNKASSSLEFEKADLYKTKLALLENFQTKSLVVNKNLTDIDVITITSSAQDAFVNYFQVKEGAIVFSENLRVTKKIEEPDEDILSYAALELRIKYVQANNTILSNKPLTVKPDNVENIVPLIGDKRKLVELSLKNAMFQRRRVELERDQKRSKNEKILSILQSDLGLKALPSVIECFDNSNLQGGYPVASMVRFVNGKPEKAGYRHFNIKTVIGPDDFASMREIVRRRYSRLLEESGQLPDLIIVDGGKGQLSSACEALKELSLYKKIPVIGIAKKLEEIYYPEDPLPLHINKKSPGLQLVQQIRDEAHRFAITFHRLKRSQGTLRTGIQDIPGIGKKTTDLLLGKFKSWKKIQHASREDLVALVGKKKAALIVEAKKKES